MEKEKYHKKYSCPIIIKNTTIMCPLLMLDSPMYEVLLGQNIIDASNAYIVDNKMNFITYYGK